VEGNAMTSAEQSHELASHDPRDHRALRRYVTTWDGETHARTLAGIQDDMTYGAFTGEYLTFAEKAMLGFLAKPSEYRKLDAAVDKTNAALVKARAEVSSIQQELDDLADQVGSGALSATLAARAEPGIQARLDEARKLEQELSTPVRLRALIKPGPGVASRWEAAPMSTRREVARLLLSPDGLGELRVMRRPRNAGPRHVPVRHRVQWRTNS
jgi:hypothetical protein